VSAKGPSSERRADARLPLSTKAVYGAPAFAGAAMAIPVAIHMPKFYTDTVLVPLGAVALAMALARVLDAIVDPFLGWLSDHTRSRWGRRRPWIFAMAPVAALFFFALFSPPAGLEPAVAAVWFGATLLLYFTLHAACALPHAALGPELTLDYHERSSLFGWREGIAVVGTMVAAVVPGLLAQAVPDARLAFRWMAAAYAGLSVVLYWLLAWRVRERPEFALRESNPLVPGVRRALRNRPFNVLLLCYVVASVPGAIPGLLMPYFNQYVIAPENPDGWLAVFLLAYFGTGFLCLPLWVAAARRFGKTPTWLASFLMGITGGAGMFLLGKGDTLALLALIAWAGCPFGAGLFLGPAIQADVIDYDELHTGKRREAQYMAFWGLVPKFIVIPSASVPLAMLAWLGYVPNAEQTPQVILAIKAIFALTPALFSTLAFFIAWRFPITEEIHREILRGIERHGRGEPALDPLTGQLVPPPGARAVDEQTGWFLDHFSKGELSRALRSGPRRALLDVIRAAALALLLALGLALFVVRDLGGSVSSTPGPLAVIAIVCAGFSFTAFVFHLLRIGPARRLGRGAVPAAAIRAHLQSVHSIGAPEPGLPVAAA
jgi:GPH family glycoside/pentoside/hexuronide:cation symporter